jgi:hypothetical protein
LDLSTGHRIGVITRSRRKLRTLLVVVVALIDVCSSFLPVVAVQHDKGGKQV